MASTNSTIPSSTHGDSTGAHTGSNVADKIESGLKGIHGVGEAIRGNANAAVDSANGDRAGVAKNGAIADRGLDQVENARVVGGTAGAGGVPGKGAVDHFTGRGV